MISTNLLKGARLIIAGILLEGKSSPARPPDADLVTHTVSGRALGAAGAGRGTLFPRPKRCGAMRTAWLAAPRA
ncbi:MAG: hypothetical protein ACLUEQ_07920 [Cloacibacillus evryensis]